jgi:hypothetical protein
MSSLSDELESLALSQKNDFLDAIIAQIEQWKIDPVENLKAFADPFTPEQLEYFNIGVQSVAAMLESVRDGEL